MFENPRGGRQGRNFTTIVSKILDLKSSSEQIFSEDWRWVPLTTSRSCSDCKEMYKKVWCTYKIVVLVIKPIAFLTSSLPSPSSDLKVPNTLWGRFILLKLKWMLLCRIFRELIINVSEIVGYNIFVWSPHLTCVVQWVRTKPSWSATGYEESRNGKSALPQIVYIENKMQIW